MAFTVEDGTGLLDSNAYIDVAFLDDYWTTRGVTLVGSSTVKQQGIVRATDFVEKRFRTKFKGRRLVYGQALSFPRDALYDADDVLVEGVPKRFGYAIAEYTTRAITSITTEVLQPDPTVDHAGVVVASKKKIGPIEIQVEYDGAGAPPLRVYPAADAYLAEYLWAAGSDRA